MHSKEEIVQYDSKSYRINGKQVFLNSGAIHYFRMPREEWREVLVKAKLAGMNCVDTYFAWNIHEPEEGKWNFEGDNDCGDFLDLCAELGLWVIARPGPYICAEWDFGGFPWWLNNKKDIKFRTYNKPYLDYVDRYFDKMIPIISDRQVTNGGAVILVQVENEYGYLADDEIAADYMQHLREGLIQRGIEVPLITCVGGVEGTIEGANFWSNADQHYDNLRTKQPDTPKIVTEFWTGWFEHWGAMSATQKTAALYEKRTLEVLRAGYSGISHYMFFGGTNFGNYGGRTVGASDIFMVTSYDYDAPLNEYGRVTEKYNVAKKLAYFVKAIEGLLLNSVEGVCEDIESRLSKGFTARYREQEDQRIWFVESEKDERETTYLTLASGNTIPVTVKPGAITPVLERVEIVPNVRLTSNTYLLSNEEVEGIHTLIIATDNGERSWVELESEQPIQLDGLVSQQMDFSTDGKRLTLDNYHFNETQVISLIIAKKQFQLIFINGEMAKNTWRVDDHKGIRWALGYPDMNILEDGSIKVALSRSGNGVLHLGKWDTLEAFSDGSVGVSPYVHLDAPEVNVLTTQVAELSLRAGGTSKEAPIGFSELGQPYGHILYTCDFEQGENEKRTVVIPAVQDTIRVFVNGRNQHLIREVGAVCVLLDLVPNQTNHLQFLVQNMGRLNFSPYLGEMKGIAGTIYLDGSTVDIRDQWQYENTSIHLGKVCKVEPGKVIHRTFTLKDQDRAILVGAMIDKLRINGQQIVTNGIQDGVSFQTADISSHIREGVNEIEMCYMKSPIDRLELIAYHSRNELNDWHMQDVSTLERIEDHNREVCGVPSWHTLQFARSTLPEYVHARLKLRLTGMSKGIVKLNGIHLGRYWQIGPQEDYKIPMAWLQDMNKLELFDEEGRSPLRVRLIYDLQSSERWISI
ncbi:glycoside hydrolase family 35 protein [Paenibacillus crassostreae]|uniref:Beta-galactosidase n=1 Tax=Paenibacillus crassostreae TaxID=1763538 RepID=A0A167EVK6_9BACL|nr:beta-galactosidase family protein [Paenibacillus crassostreae]AOZ93425.1 beta-galactosidase [Paenibacillus crassostreae]OAB75920.1 beta-galactosidase [Paenibacillus crassostreae]